MIIINKFGEFESEIMDILDDEYSDFVNVSKSFWVINENNLSFRLWLNEGAVIFPPDIISKSILKITT